MEIERKTLQVDESEKKKREQKTMSEKVKNESWIKCVCLSARARVLTSLYKFQVREFKVSLLLLYGDLLLRLLFIIIFVAAIYVICYCYRLCLF